MNVAAECLLAALGREETPEDETEAEAEQRHVRSMVGAALLADGLHSLEQILKALTTTA